MASTGAAVGTDTAPDLEGLGRLLDQHPEAIRQTRRALTAGEDEETVSRPCPYIMS